MRSWCVAAAVIALVGCQSNFELTAADAETNATPLAQAGTGTSAHVTKSVQLDGSGSFDPDGPIVAYRWAVVTKPTGSMPSIADPSAEITSLVLDALGRYEVELRVTDENNAVDSDRVTFNSTAPSVAVEAGADQQLTWLQTVQLSGALTVEPGFTATAQWSLVQKPAKSTATLIGGTTLTPSFYADAEGIYVVQLVGATAYGQSIDSVAVTVTAPRMTFNYVVVAADYSKALDRMIIASDAPPRLHVVDPETAMDTLVVLPASPTSLSLDPTGLRAAVGHDGSVTTVNLQTGAVERADIVPAYVYRLVFGASNRVHCLPQGFGSYPIRTLDLTTGAVTNGPSIFGYTSAQATPDGQSMYTIAGAVFPPPVDHWDLRTNPITSVRTVHLSSPDASSPIAFSEDGASMFFGNGRVYYASSSAVTDVTLRGTLGTYMSGASHSAAVDRVGWFQITYDAWSNPNGTRLSVSDAQTFAVLRQIELPDTVVAGQSYVTLGKRVGFRSDGSKLYILGTAGNAAVLFGVTP